MVVNNKIRRKINDLQQSKPKSKKEDFYESLTVVREIYHKLKNEYEYILLKAKTSSDHDCLDQDYEEYNELVSEYQEAIQPLLDLGEEGKINAENGENVQKIAGNELSLKNR